MPRSRAPTSHPASRPSSTPGSRSPAARPSRPRTSCLAGDESPGCARLHRRVSVPLNADQNYTVVLGSGEAFQDAGTGTLTADLLGDLDGDGLVNGADLGFLLGAWGTDAADLDGDGTTDGSDFGLLLSLFTA